ncbi:MAG: thioesterase family protein [Anaerolineae bacterium]|nr:thioesterase family protein [Anaerolineae bacterium]
MFEKMLYVRWGDTDANGHMRNTAYLDKSADVRMMFFAENGFPMDAFAQRRIGPVIMKDEVDYYREVHILAPLRVTFLLGGLAEDGSRFIIRNEFWRVEGDLAARVTSIGGWLDLAARKLVVPPESLLTAMRTLPHTDDYRDLPSSIKPRGS